jgi:hypothetical protein
MARSKKSTTIAKKFLSKLYKSVESDAVLKSEYNRAAYTFWGAAEPYYVSSRDDVLVEEAKGRFIEWFLFDHVIIDLHSQTPAEWYLEKHKNDIKESEYKRFEEFIQSEFGIFGIQVADKKKGILVRDIKDNTFLTVRKRGSVKSFQPGRCIVGRIFPYEDHYILSDFCDLLSNTAIFENSKDKNVFLESLNAMNWEKYHKIQYSGKHPIQRTKSVKTIKRKIQPLLFYLTGNQMTVARLSGMIRKEKNFFDLYNKVEKNIDFRTKQEIKTFILYLKALWNYIPRKELANKSLTEFFEENVAGPVERSLLAEIFDFTFEAVNPTEYPTFKAAKKEIAKIQKKWMNTKRDDLDGLTPKQAILKERKEMGNPSKKIDTIINLHRI